MKRGKKVVFLSHCLLNVNAKVMGLADYPGAVRGLISFLMDNDIALVQLPCPEMEILGLSRWGVVKDQLSYPFFIRQCRSLLAPFINQVKMYREKEYDLVGVIGVDGSPSCGVSTTCRSRLWEGDFLDKEESWAKIESMQWSREPGIFMETFQNLLKEEGLPLDFYALDETGGGSDSGSGGGSGNRGDDKTSLSELLDALSDTCHGER